MYLPLLPLETYRPRWSEPGPHVVVERERILIASAEAREAGVRVGMKRGGALTLCADVVLHERDEKRELAALDSVAPQHSLIMDITARPNRLGRKADIP